MDDGTREGPLLAALSTIRLSTVPLFFLALLFVFTRAKTTTPSSPGSIIPVVVSTVTPRRALLITLFLFASITYLLDGLIVLIYWVTRGFRQSYFTQWRGVELADVAGFLAFFSVIIIGAWKDRRGIDLWMRKRLKFWTLLAIALDIAYLVLLVLSVRIFKKRPSQPGIPERPNIPGIYVPNFLHFIALDARLFILLITLIVLFKPSTTYSTVAHSAHGHEAGATPSTLLLPASLGGQQNLNQQAYGTFAPPAHDPPKAHVNGDSLEAGHAKDGLKGYDASSSTHQAAEGSSSRSVHSKKDQPILIEEVTDEPEPYVPKQNDLEDVPNPVTNDPEALTTSYAAVAAKAADKAAHGEEPSQEIVAPSDANKDANSPNAFAFPSATRDDSSSMRGVTFSTEPIERNGEGGDGEEIVGTDGKKRRRISSQNFKRIVRKISEIPKRQGSISSLGSASRSLGNPGIEGAPVGQTTPKRNRASREDSRMSGEGSISYTPSGESPAPSIGEEGKKRSFRKRMSLSLRGPPKEGSKDSGSQV